LPEDIRSFLQEHTLTDACALQKVFIGKIIARLFVFVQAEDEDTAAFLLNDIRKDILDCRYCG
jgi:acyl-coA dehydrogenase domain protein